MKFIGEGLSFKSRQTNVDENIAKNDNLSTSSSFAMASTVTASGSSETSVQDYEIVDFTISIESFDGIIMTSCATTNITNSFVSSSKKSSTGPSSVPVLGVVTYQQMAGNHSKVKTHIPSMPLVKSKSSIGKRERYCAVFGKPSNRNKKASSGNQEQIKISLPMKRSKSRPSGYAERQLNLTIGIMRGSEVIKLGAASVPLNGDEYGESRLIPIVQKGNEKSSTIQISRTYKSSRITSGRPKTILGARSACFSSDPSRKYSIQCASLRLSIKARFRGTEATHENKEIRTEKSSIFSRFLPPRNEPEVSVQVVQSNDDGFNDGFEMIHQTPKAHISRDSLLYHSKSDIMSLSNTYDSPIASREDESYASSCHESAKSYDEGLISEASSRDSGESSSDDDSSAFDDTTVGDTTLGDTTLGETTLGDESTLIDNVSLGTIKKFRELGYAPTFKGI